MKIVVISSANKSTSEIDYIIKFLQSGADYFHIKKKGFSKKKMKRYLEQIPNEFRHRLILHSHYGLAIKYKLGGIHLSSKQRKRWFRNALRFLWYRLMHPRLIYTTSYHSIQGLVDAKRKYHYVFLSPVFDIHEMTTFSAAYSEAQLIKTLKKSKQEVIALGGVNASNVATAFKAGFEGIALHGIIWREKLHRHQKFEEVIAASVPFKG